MSVRERGDGARAQRRSSAIVGLDGADGAAAWTRGFAMDEMAERCGAGGLCEGATGPGTRGRRDARRRHGSVRVVAGRSDGEAFRR